MSDTEFMSLYLSLEKIREALQGDGYFSLDEEDSVREARSSYEVAGHLIVSTWEMVKDRGFKTFFSGDYEEHSLLGDLVTTLESYYYLIGDFDKLYNILVHDLPSVDKITSFIPFDTHIYIYRSEIARYAKLGNESKSWTLYNTLINLRNNRNEIIPKNLTALEQLSELWAIDY